MAQQEADVADPAPDMAPVIGDHLLATVRERLDAHGWLTVQEPQLIMSHTIGLTRYGLPELVVRHADDETCQLLDRWSARLVSGELMLTAKLAVQDLQLRDHQYPVRLYDVTTQGGLWLPRALYGNRLVVREIDIRSCPCLPCRAGG